MISLEITLNDYKCLIASLVLLKSLPSKQHHYYLFQLVPCLSVNLLWCQECIFDIHIQQQNHQTDLNSCLSLYWQDHCWIGKKTQTRNLTVFMVVAIWPSSPLKYLFVFYSVNVWEIFSLRNSQQITFVTLNRFCPLSKLPQLPCS